MVNSFRAISCLSEATVSGGTTTDVTTSICGLPALRATNPRTDVMETEDGSIDSARATSTIYWRLKSASNASMLTETMTEKVTDSCAGGEGVPGCGLVASSGGVVVVGVLLA